MTVLLMSENFTGSDVVSNATYSSEQTAFPASNVYNLQRRSKVWRSNGYWDITSSNNTLQFRETTGVNLTATLTVQSYASTTLLLAEIKTQMEAVGGSTYTLATDANTSKIKFTSNGAGGGGILEVNWTVSTALGGVLGFDISANDTGFLTYTADELRIGTEEWLKWDFGISTNPKAFVAIGSRNNPIKVTPSATIKLQGNETDVWTSPSYDQTITYNDRAWAQFSSSGLHTEGLRYWRLQIVDLDNPNGFVELGAIFLGDSITFTRGRVQFPFQANYVDRSPTVFSEGGQTFSDVREKTEEFSLEWAGITVAEKEDIDLMFDTFGTSSPFFISMDPDDVFSSSSQYYIRYVKFSSQPNYRLVSPANFEMSMNLREEL